VTNARNKLENEVLVVIVIHGLCHSHKEEEPKPTAHTLRWFLTTIPTA